MGKKSKKTDGRAKHLKELKESFLSLCGVDSSALQSPERADLVAALQSFQTTDENDYESVETAAWHLRSALDSFAGYLELEREEVFEIFRELHSHELLLPQGKLALLSIHTNYVEKLSSEQDILVEVIDYLDQLYSIPRNNMKLKFWTTCLVEGRVILSVPLSQFLDGENLDLSKDKSKDVERPADNVRSQTAPAAKNLKLSPPSQEILKAVDNFLDNPPLENATYFLVFGPSGSGKTYLCNQIELRATKSVAVRVIRPKIPVDFMGFRVGDAESMMLSIFSEIVAFTERTILILDDIDNLIETEDEPDYASIAYRLKLTFISCLDQCRASNCLLVCTSSAPLDDTLQRFEKTFVLGVPNFEQRVSMIRSSMRLDESSEEEIEVLLERLGKCTLGRSRAEIVKYYRNAILAAYDKSIDVETLTGKRSILQTMNDTITQLTPASLRSGFIDGYVDMCVKSGAELLGPGYEKELSLPLIGDEVAEAWRQLESVVVTQLCRADALDKMLYGGNGGHRKLFCGGVLLTGCPGSGKTSLAYHAARVAATLLPSVKLVDVSCTSLVHKEVGGSEKALRRLFMAVRAATPCIVLLEGIENIAALRGNDTTTHGTMDRILSTLLVELDGIDSTVPGNKEETSKFALIGITHKASWIDPALKRPGRLDKTIELQKPDRRAREAIARRILEEQGKESAFKTDDINVIASKLAEESDNQTGAEVIALCEELKVKRMKDELCRNFDGDEQLI